MCKSFCTYFKGYFSARLLVWQDNIFFMAFHTSPNAWMLYYGYNLDLIAIVYRYLYTSFFEMLLQPTQIYYLIINRPLSKNIMDRFSSTFNNKFFVGCSSLFHSAIPFFDGLQLSVNKWKCLAQKSIPSIFRCHSSILNESLININFLCWKLSPNKTVCGIFGRTIKFYRASRNVL